jgi:cobalt-zinc-cadmium efflux system outer membrane protein
MMKCVAAAAIVAILSGCVPYRPRPVSVEENARVLTARSLEGAATHGRWTFAELVRAALEVHPDLDVARAELKAAQAAIRQAAERPNPTVNVGLERLSGSGDVSPWITSLGIDVPFETAGKRGARVQQAKALTVEAAANVDQAIWTVRSGVGRAITDLARSNALRTSRQREAALRDEIVAIYARRLEVGESATPEVARARAEARAASAAVLAEEGKLAAAESVLATAIGIPRSALPEVDLSTIPMTVRVDDRLQLLALTARPDVLAAVARFEAADAALRLEVSNQYPDVHLSPGIGWDQGQFKWTIGAVAELPIFDRHQGAIGRAEAERERAAAQLLALQARILGDVEQARTRERTARARLDATTRVFESRETLLAAARKQFQAGEIDRLALRVQELESAAAAADREDARYDVAAAIVELEAVVEQSLGGDP